VGCWGFVSPPHKLRLMDGKTMDTNTVVERRKRRLPTKGYKRAIATLEVNRFIGWGYIKDLLAQVPGILEEQEQQWRKQLEKVGAKEFDGFRIVKAKKYKKIFGGQYKEIHADERTILEHKAFIVTLFKTGGRVSELIGLPSEDGWDTEPLRVDQIDFTTDKKWISVNLMRVNKRYKKTKREMIDKYTARPPPSQVLDWKPSKKRPGMFYKKGWETARKDVFRSYKFPSKEPMNDILIDWCKTISAEYGAGASDEWLFAQPYHYWYTFLRKLDIMKQKYGPPVLWTSIYHHWFRAQRASQLKQDYGLTIDEIGEWGKWESLEVVRAYVGTEQVTEDKMLKKAEEWEEIV